MGWLNCALHARPQDWHKSPPGFCPPLKKITSLIPSSLRVILNEHSNNLTRLNQKANHTVEKHLNLPGIHQSEKSPDEIIPSPLTETFNPTQETI